MADITAEVVRELRDKTGAGMMDCKKALVASAGDLNKAIEHLRKSGIAKAAKKIGRETAEGKIAAKLAGNTGVMVELRCETDFVAKNSLFVGFVQRVCDSLISDYQGNRELTDLVQEREKEAVTELISKVGENIAIRRAVRWEGGRYATYLHMGGRIGVLLDCDGIDDASFLTDICMHIAAFNPTYVSPGAVPGEILQKEKEIAAAQPELADKPEAIREKITQGKINKWFTENCLVKQPWIRDDKTSIEKLKPNAKVNRFLRWQVGTSLS